MDLENEFRELLDKNEKEEVYQKFLEKHTELIPTNTFLLNHGVHFSLIFSKMPIGSQFISDFFLISKSSAEWNYIFIELEKPSAKLFTKSGGRSQDLARGIKQIEDWNSYFLTSANKEAFKNQPIIHKITSFNPTLHENPCNFKYILVIGRRKELEDNNSFAQWRALNNNLKNSYIMTYDSLCESIEQKAKQYICHIRKNFLYIDNNELLNKMLFCYTDCNNIRIKQNVLNALEAALQKHPIKDESICGMLGEDTNKKIERLRNNVIKTNEV